MLIKSNIKDSTDYEWVSIMKFGVFFKPAQIQGQKIEYKYEKTTTDWEYNESYEQYHVLTELYNSIFSFNRQASDVEGNQLNHDEDLMSHITSGDFTTYISAFALNSF